MIRKLRMRMNENMDDPTPTIMELSRKTEEIEKVDLFMSVPFVWLNSFS